MKKVLIFALLAIGILSSCDSDDNNTTATLTQDEKNDLQFLREEEKLARDVYLYAYDKYALTISNNISQSEQRHMDKVLTLLQTYGLEDPASAERGVFVNQELQTLYNDLTAQVDISMVEALKVGAIIEDLDIKDIEEFISRTNRPDILAVYDNLECGSRNHMRGYYNELITNGVTYVSQFISAEELITIITGNHEQCGM